MQKFRKIIFLFLIGVSVLAREDYMYFLVDSMQLKMKENESSLTGLTYAKKIFVSMEDVEVEIDVKDGETFIAKTAMDKDKFSFMKDRIRFSISLGEGNPVLDLTHLEIENAEVELSRKSIDIRGEVLNTHFNDIRFFVSNIDMTCETNGYFSLEIEETCIRDTKIIPFIPERKSIIELEDLSDKKDYKLHIVSSSVEIDEDRLEVFADDIDGRFKNSTWFLKNGSLECYKDPELKELDFDRFITGCIKTSVISGESISFKQSALDLNIKKAIVKFMPTNFSIKAESASFKGGERPTWVSGLSMSCDKSDFSNDSSSRSTMFGCLKKSSISIDEIKSGPKDFVFGNKGNKKTDIKSFTAKIDNGDFDLTAKIKILWRMKIKMKGHARYDSKPNQIRVDVNKASISGLSTKTLALYFLRKFIDSNRIKISGTSIIIQL